MSRNHSPVGWIRPHHARERTGRRRLPVASKLLLTLLMAVVVAAVVLVWWEQPPAWLRGPRGRLVAGWGWAHWLTSAAVLSLSFNP